MSRNVLMETGTTLIHRMTFFTALFGKWLSYVVVILYLFYPPFFRHPKPFKCSIKPRSAHLASLIDNARAAAGPHSWVQCDYWRSGTYFLTLFIPCSFPFFSHSTLCWIVYTQFALSLLYERLTYRYHSLSLSFSNFVDGLYSRDFDCYYWLIRNQTPVGGRNVEFRGILQQFTWVTKAVLIASGVHEVYLIII